MSNVERRPHLTKLTLGGFQVFDKATEIPLGALTLLFGPNSAGKSVVQDSLELLADLHWGADWDQLSLARHWRRSESGELSPIMNIGFTATTYVGFRDLWGYCAARPEISGERAPNPRWNGDDVSSMFEFRLRDEEADPIPRSPSRYALGINGVELLQVSPRGNRVGVNFQHPEIRGLGLRHDLLVLAETLPFFEREEGWVFFKSFFVGLDGLFATKRESLLHGAVVLADRADGAQDRVKRSLLEHRSAVDEFLDFFDEIHSSVLGNAKFRPDVVQASRHTPTPRDLTFHFTAEVDSRPLPDLDCQADPMYLPLARAAYAECTSTKPLAARSDVSSVLSFSLGDLALFQRVNQALGHHLFAERGYAVAADVRFLVSAYDAKNGLRPQDPRLPDYDAIVHLYLKDHAGRNFDFADVGSGLGYVLPVLTSVCDRSLALSLLQQPELHLHPALQASLGDVLIEHASSDHQIIAETHSEHLLLRVLKRIRQTSSGYPIDPALRASPADVVVAYFDPRPDGTTSVRRLRISDDGEFLDRWPRGFFTERDNELFDE